MAADDAGLKALLAKIERRGLRVSSYKEPCLRRRLAVRMRARNVHTFDDYARLLDSMPDEFDLLLDAITINVTKFFRNPETYAAIKARVLPALLGNRQPAAGNREIAVWSAGSATGEEPYSLAILFREAGATKVRIDATDLDPGALAFLGKAAYPESAVSEVPPELLRRHFTAGPPYTVSPDLKRLVHPIRHDLTKDPAPQPPYDLITCRNVVIYFDRPMQERLFQTFFDALVPGGWLVLGKVETLFGPARTAFRAEDPRERLFRKPA